MSQFFLDPLRVFRKHEPHEESLSARTDSIAQDILKTAAIPAARPELADFFQQDSDNPFNQIRYKPGSRVKQVWAIGGGKGGVGKSLISSSVSIALSRTGNTVCAIDLDLGAANLHTMLGVEPSRQTLSDFIHGRVEYLNDCMARTSIPNLNIISGAQDSVGMANLPLRSKVRVLEALREIDADYVIVDLGAGTSQNTIDFFIGADLGIMTILPEPTSIENAYRFIKSIYYRKLALSPHLYSVRELINAAADSKNDYGIKTPADLFREISRRDPEAATRLKEEIERLRPKLIVNQTRTQADIDIGFSIKSICKKYFGIDMDYLGYLDYDNSVWQSIRRKRPIFLEFPNSKIVSSIDRIVQFVVKRYGHVRNL